MYGIWANVSPWDVVRFLLSSENFWKIVTVFIAAAGVYVAMRKYILDKEKFKLDLFDKRFQVFKGARLFLSRILILGRPDLQEDWINYRASIGEAGFLFEQDMVDYLELISKKAVECHGLEASLEIEQDYEKRKKLIDSKAEIFDWLQEQLPELIIKFSPYLKFRQWK